MILRCTAKILKLLGPDALSTSGSAIDPHDDDWYLNLLWLDGRKCVLVTQAGTLFSALAADVKVAALRSIGTFTVKLIERELESEGLPLDVFGQLDPADVNIAKTADRSVLGCMNDMGHMCRFTVEDAGSLERCDLGALNHRLRRTILGPLGSTYPIELVLERVGDLGPCPRRFPKSPTRAGTAVPPIPELPTTPAIPSCPILQLRSF